MGISIISECREGDTIYSIHNWVDPSTCTSEKFDMDECEEFHIGEKLIFIDAFQEKDKHRKTYNWFVNYKREDGLKLSALLDYFVTEDEWFDIKKAILQKYHEENSHK